MSAKRKLLFIYLSVRTVVAKVHRACPHYRNSRHSGPMVPMQDSTIVIAVSATGSGEHTLYFPRMFTFMIRSRRR